jgi:Mn2+/Fe2+ NRAMP family transporter
VTLMSRTGSLYGYQMLWLAILSGALMAGFIALFMRFGIYSDETFLGLTAKRIGRWFAVLCGISLFMVDATFQFGNCLGVTAAMANLIGGVPKLVWPIAFTASAIVFLFAFNRIYRIIEKLMAALLLMMLAAFLINLVWAKPHVPSVLKGVGIPTIPQGVHWVTLAGLVATTFCIVVAFFQSYLVKAKGWGRDDLASGVVDTVLASITFTLVGCVIMMTAAAVLFGKQTVDSAVAMAAQLKGVFGPYAKLVFCIGFWAAAFSSFITNSLIGGVLLNDGLGFGGKLESLPTKIFATCVLLIGMTTAIAIMVTRPQAPAPSTTIAVDAKADASPPAASQPKGELEVKAIALAQAVTMLAVPLGAIAMVVVLFDKRAVKGRALPLWTKAFVLFGAAVLLGIAAMMCVKIKPELIRLLGMG